MSFEMYNLGKPLNDNTDLILQSWGMKAAPKAGYSNSALSKKIDKDTLQISKNTSDGRDDGKISFKEKIKNFGKGIIAPFKAMVSSPKNIAITVASAAAVAGIIALTGGAAAPVFVAAGLLGGGVQIGKGIYKQATAKTDAQAANAWQDMGSGTVTVGLSAAGAKGSLKAAKVSNVKDMSVLKASLECIKSVPKQLKTSWTNASGKISGAINLAPKGQTTTTGDTSALPDGQVADAPKKSKFMDLFKKKSKKAGTTNSQVDAPETVTAQDGAGAKKPAEKSGSATQVDAPETVTAQESTGSSQSAENPKPVKPQADAQQKTGLFTKIFDGLKNLTNPFFGWGK